MKHDIGTDLQKLNCLIPTYEEYAARQWTSEARQRMASLLNPDSVQAFNALVSEFNAIAAQNKITPDLARAFVGRANTIVKGEKQAG